MTFTLPQTWRTIGCGLGATFMMLVHLPGCYANGEARKLCPNADREILSGCKGVRYTVLPPDALRLIKHLRCDDYDSETTSVTLGRRGAADYKICCHEPDHGPCEAIVIGQIGGRWRNLTANDSILGFDGCTGFIPLESQHDGFHDICLSEQGSNVTPIVRGAPQIPALLQFKAGQYREVRNPPPE